MGINSVLHFIGDDGKAKAVSSTNPLPTGGGGTSSGTGASAPRYTISMTFADDGTGNPVLPTYTIGSKNNITTVNVVNTPQSWNTYLQTNAVLDVYVNGLSVILSLDRPIALQDNAFSVSSAAGLLSLISDNAIVFIKNGCFASSNIENLVLHGVKSINGGGFLAGSNELQNLHCDAEYIYNLSAQVDANTPSVLLNTFGMRLITADVISDGGDAETALSAGFINGASTYTTTPWNLTLNSALLALNGYTANYRTTQFDCTGLKMLFSSVNLNTSTQATIRYTLHK